MPFLALLLAAAPDLPPGRAVVAFDLPDKAALTIDGTDHTARPEVAFDGCQPGRFHTKRATITLADGTALQKDILIRGGWRIRVPVTGPARDRPELVAQSGHGDFVSGVAFTPDGQYLVTSSYDRTAVLWEAATGRQLRTYSGSPNILMGVAVSPDGIRVATAAGRHQTFIEPVGEAAVHDLETGTRTHRFDVNGPVQCVTFTPDGKRVVFGGWDGKLYVAELAGSVMVKTIPAHAGPVWAVAADSAGVVTASVDGTAAAWDIDTGRELKRFRGHAGGVYGVALRKNGQVVTASQDGTARLWDRASGTVVREFRGHEGVVYAVAVSPAGDRLLTGGSDKTARVWDADTGKQLHTFTGHTDTVLAAAFHPTKPAAATAGMDLNGYQWRLSDGAKLAEYRSRLDRPWGHWFSPDGASFVGGAGDDLVLRWEPAAADPLRSLGGHAKLVRGVHFAPTGKRFLTGSDDQTAKVWDATTRTPIATLPANPDPAAGHADIVLTMKLSPDGKTAFTGTRAGRKRDGPAIKFDPPGWGYLWDAATGKLLRRVGEGRGSLWDAEFTPDGKYLVTADGDEAEGDARVPGKAIVWDAATGAKVRTLVELPGMLTALAAAPDSQRILVCAKDKSAVVYDLTTGAKVRAFAGFDQPVAAAAFLPDGNYVLLASFDGLIRLKDAATGVTVRQFAGHTGPVDVLAPKTGGRYLLSGGGDGVLRYWDIASGDQLAWLVSLDRGRDWLTATPDGLFDGTAAGRDNVRFRVGGKLDVTDADRFFKDFYHPGLLREVWAGTPPRAVAKLGAKPAPVVRILTPSPSAPLTTTSFPLDVEVADRGGGIGKVSVRVDGTNILIAPRSKQRDGAVERRRYVVPTLTAGDNVIVVQAEAEAKGAAESEPARLRVSVSLPRDERVLHPVAVGVSRYTDPKLTLRYAAADAKQLAGLLAARGVGVFDRVAEPIVLCDDRAGRGAIEDALAGLADRVKPADTVVVFLSGHGACDPGTNRYFFIPHDFPAGPAALEAAAVSGERLFELVQKLPCKQRVVILETCQSGAAERELTAVAAAGTTGTRNTGIILMTAAQSGVEAHENETLKHGVLTYCLLRSVGAAGPLRLPDGTAVPLDPLPGPRVRVHSWLTDAGSKVSVLMDRLYSQSDHFAKPVFGARDFEVLKLRE